MTDADRKRRLLVVDDDPNLRELFSFAMAQQGFEVAQASDGEQGLAKIEAFQPDIVVLDLMMPKVNGFMLLGKLQEKQVRVKVVVLTGFWEQANESLLREDPNVVDFIRKPVKYADLADLMRRIDRGDLSK